MGYCLGLSAAALGTTYTPSAPSTARATEMLSVAVRVSSMGLRHICWAPSRFDMPTRCSDPATRFFPGNTAVRERDAQGTPEVVEHLPEPFAVVCRQLSDRHAGGLVLADVVDQLRERRGCRPIEAENNFLFLTHVPHPTAAQPRSGPPVHAEVGKPIWATSTRASLCGPTRISCRPARTARAGPLMRPSVRTRPPMTDQKPLTAWRRHDHGSAAFRRPEVQLRSPAVVTWR